MPTQKQFLDSVGLTELLDELGQYLKTTIPTVNNATLTIQKNGTNVATFTANASTGATANITVPTATSDLTNDSGFITGYTETDPVFAASAAHGIASSDITAWNNKQDALTFDTAPTASSANPVTSGGVKTALDAKQATLVSGTSIKTVNSTSLLGSGNVSVQPTLVSGTNIKTINNESLLGSGNIDIQGGGSSMSITYDANRTALVIGGVFYTITLSGNAVSAITNVLVDGVSHTYNDFPLNINEGKTISFDKPDGVAASITMDGVNITNSSNVTNGNTNVSVTNITGDINITLNGGGGGAW